MNPRKLMLALAMFAGILPAQAAPNKPPAIRAVFVGIDDYAFSEPTVADAGFKDLSGAVNDARAIKEALRSLYRLDLDRETVGACASANAVSITLTDQCATGAAIFDAWRKQIAASAPGDTLILYFAGHGSQVADSDSFTQASGYHSTLMPHNARDPNSPELSEILDTDIKRFIDEATAKGVNVVSIFDSCHSATATRDGPADGEARAAPLLRFQRPLPRLTPAIAPGPNDGYRVHLAASADGEEAREVGAVGNRAGLFTTALIAALRAMPNAAFADIAAEVQLKVAATGHRAQRPHAEGALTATLGGKERAVPLFDAALDGDQLWLDGGQLTGVTKGSQFALFATTSAALDDRAAPLAAAVVAAAGPSRATLTLTAPPAAALPERMIARETAHDFGEDFLLVRIGATGGDATAIATVLATMNFVRAGEPAAVAVVPAGNGYRLAGADGMTIAALGPLSAPSFADRLRGGLQKIARVNMLLALRTGPAASDVHFCIDADVEANPFGCRPGSEPAVIPVGKEVKLIGVNRAEGPRHIYVYLIDENYGVTLVLPPSGAVEAAVASGRPVVDYGKAGRKQRLTFLTLATDQPIKASVLEQGGVGARDPGACTSALARALCAAQQGTRDPAVSSVGNWTAGVTTAIVK